MQVYLIYSQEKLKKTLVAHIRYYLCRFLKFCLALILSVSFNYCQLLDVSCSKFPDLHPYQLNQETNLREKLENLTSRHPWRGSQPIIIIFRISAFLSISNYGVISSITIFDTVLTATLHNAFLRNCLIIAKHLHEVYL